MRVLNLYFSATGNTEKVAMRISEAVRESGHEVDALKVTRKDIEIDILKYNFVFVGSGVYAQQPGTPLIELFKELMQKYRKADEIQLTSPRRPSAYVVVYCTYGGAHTGINEAIPAVKYMGQLFDHLGYTIMAEWYIVGEYKTERYRRHSVAGRLGDIRDRPNEADLQDVAARVKGILQI
jgi:menaquinone-dependent protoporphyrinogen IX oxidase